MPKVHRLTRADIQAFEPLRREGGRFFTAAIAKNQVNKPRFTVVVSKKVALRASLRATIKRRARAALRAETSLPGYDIIFTAKRSAVEADYKHTALDIHALLKKLSLA